MIGLFQDLNGLLYLHEALQRYTGACEDPRDKIFGLNALIKEDEQVVIDYSKPASLIFWDTVAAIIQEIAREEEQRTTIRQSTMWLLALGHAMGVTGSEPNAIVVNPWSNNGSVGFVWPRGFYGLIGLGAVPQY